MARPCARGKQGVGACVREAGQVSGRFSSGMLAWTSTGEGRFPNEEILRHFKIGIRKYLAFTSKTGARKNNENRPGNLWKLSKQTHIKRNIYVQLSNSAFFEGGIFFLALHTVHATSQAKKKYFLVPCGEARL